MVEAGPRNQRSNRVVLREDRRSPRRICCYFNLLVKQVAPPSPPVNAQHFPNKTRYLPQTPRVELGDEPGQKRSWKVREFNSALSPQFVVPVLPGTLQVPEVAKAKPPPGATELANIAYRYLQQALDDLAINALLTHSPR